MTDTETTTQELTAQTQQRNEIRLAGPRLPYHPAIEERFGIDRATWKVLTDVLFPAAEAPESIIMAVSYCKARKLDIMKKPVHIVPVWDKKRGAMVDSVWPAIAETRITAMRTGVYAGKDETVFGPDKTLNLGGVEITFPEWAQVTVYRLVGGIRCPFTGPKVRWLEFYAKAKRGVATPNDMWATKTYSQLEKCAEAGAIRAAFPEEDGGPTADEMHGQEVAHVVQPEVTGPGVLGRLTAQGEASGGFNDADVEGAVNGDEKPKRQRRKKTDDPSQAAVIEPEVDPAADIAPIGGGEVIDGETGEVLQEGATVESEVIDAEIEEIEQTQPAAEEPAETLEPEEEPEIVSEGYPAAGEVYFLTGDDYNEDGRRETYKDGAPFSTAKRGNPDIKVYEDHAPEGPGGSAATKPEPETEDPASGAGLLDSFKTLTTWVGEDGMKAAAAALFKKPQFSEAPEEIREEIRAIIYKEVLRINKDHAAKVDPGADATAFSLLLAYETDPDVILGTFEVLKRSPVWAKVKPDGQASVDARVSARVAYLKAKA